MHLWYNRGMAGYHFYHTIHVRYADLDTQWHVTNSHYLTFLDEARLAYLMHLGLFDGRSFLDLPWIVASVSVNFLAPIEPGQDVKVGVRITRLGHKSMHFDMQIEDLLTGAAIATSETVMVAYDYRKQQSTPISDEWRKVISSFEKIPPLIE
jgi:acyl-CoA thioester hydrolase